MGNKSSRDAYAIADNPNRRAFVTFKSRRLIGEGMMAYIVFTFTVRYQRFEWDVSFRYHNLVQLDKALIKQFPEEMANLIQPTKHNKMFFTHDQSFLETRSRMITKYLQEILDKEGIIDFLPVRILLESSQVSFSPDLGPKGKEGWLKKCSGGYLQGFSRKAGDYINVWTWRWVILQDSCISWMKNPGETTIVGNLQIDQKFGVQRTGRLLTIVTATRRLLLFAGTTRAAEEWELALKTYYASSLRIARQLHDSSFPPRLNCSVKLYTYPKDYYQSLAHAMLSAQKEILITSWKNSPTVLLTRPPLPPIRLDQLLKYKAEQGVQIYVLLYKEVEHIGQGNDSAGAKKKLEGLSPNIHVIRHPNKFYGGSTAVLWSHHEKMVVIDRNSVYLGGIDLAFQRWDDEHHRIADEEGLMYPGNDYRQPAPAVFKPARNLLDEQDVVDPLDEDMVEVEVTGNHEPLPVALSALVDGDDDQPYEVEVVVDFNAFNDLNASEVAVAAPSNNGHLQLNQPGGTPPPPGQGLVGSHPSSAVSGQLMGGPNEGDDAEANLLEDGGEGTTAEERQALDRMGLGAQNTGENSPTNIDAGSTNRSSLFQSFTDSWQSSKSSINSGISNIAEHMRFYSERAQNALQAYADDVAVKKRIQKSGIWETRDQFPRMGWHDVQCGVSGRVARDCASHFIQRWNHHRLSTSDYGQPVLVEITDNTTFTVCARCKHANILETALTCPKCLYDLGATNSYSQPTSLLYQPIVPSRYSYLVFACTYSLKKPLPMRMEGDCPVVVTYVSPPSVPSSQTMTAGVGMSHVQVVLDDGTVAVSEEQRAADDLNNDEEGVLIDLCGTEAEWLAAFGLFPARGDVILAINGATVTHLNSNQLKRVIKRLRRGLSVLGKVPGIAPDTVQFTFRRHYVEGLHPIDKKEEDLDIVGAVPINDPLHKDNSVSSHNHTNANSNNNSVGSAPPALPQPISTSSLDDMAAIKQSAMRGGSSSNSLSNQVQYIAPNDCRSSNNTPNGARYRTASTPSASAVENDDYHHNHVDGDHATNAQEVTVEAMYDPKKNDNKSSVSKGGTTASAPQPVFHPICQAAAHREVALAISQMFHDHARQCDPVPRLIDESGTCKVQLLRSVGKWSVGTAQTEMSIFNAYVDAIRNAKHLIYIENQFFVSNTAGSDVQNNIVSVLCERICEAFHKQQPLRVIVILPVHPNGDYVNAMKAKVVMHYEYTTINRGLTSLYAQLTKKCPGIGIAKYIGFFSLRNWGVINNKVVSEQVYVHDKVLIVDDRIMIVGSANINDRSMLGHRDSELAVKIEDTFEIETRVNGVITSVGYFCHTMRLQLMKQHVRNDNFDWSDIVHPDVYAQWRRVSTKNSAVYDEIDGALSLYRCVTIADYKRALENAHLRSYLDPDTQFSLSEVTGFLVDWPQSLFTREDLSPSLATRAMIPNELWV